ncbi:mersacidin/lichenicidin family type 2 lantibiotic [Nostoc sp. C117]|uniref:mersacidin/lichenicidin family type 2 lantibiotic n=1 Tax=Nostoc sp. C117 TaxID=3349875 RepID=UPI00370D5B6F
MSNNDIIRAWKDEEYRKNLSEQQRSQLPENPAGIVELSDAQMESIAGGRPETYWCYTHEVGCTQYTNTPATICKRQYL